MDQAVKAKWVAALRSGEYEQGREHLEYENTFCCLGVLCDLYAKEKQIPFSERLRADGDELPAHEVCRWAGLEYNDPDVLILGKSLPLSVHNDGGVHAPKTFAQIADAIEGQL